MEWLLLGSIWLLGMGISMEIRSAAKEATDRIIAAIAAAAEQRHDDWQRSRMDRPD